MYLKVIIKILFFVFFTSSYSYASLDCKGVLIPKSASGFIHTVSTQGGALADYRVLTITNMNSIEKGLTIDFFLYGRDEISFSSLGYPGQDITVDLSIFKEISFGSNDAIALAQAKNIKISTMQGIESTHELEIFQRLANFTRETVTVFHLSEIPIRIFIRK